jgi:hypothetical protein
VGWALVIALVASCASALAAAPKDGVYRGPGAWIDIYDGAVLADPAGTVTSLAPYGVRTIYVETANYTRPPLTSIAYPIGIAQLIDAAHARDMRVVAWYLPGFKGLRRDLQRILDAIRLTTPAAGRFDSFALDIEANAVRKVALRNRRAVRLSRRIRAAVGRSYPLGAIVPDQRSTSVSLPSLWPHFPYRRIRPYYDVFLPMTYSTFRGTGSQFVYQYTRSNIEYLRLAAHDPTLRVHAIGGIANKLGPADDAAFIQAAREEGAIGASFYKLRGSDSAEWQALAPFLSP